MELAKQVALEALQAVGLLLGVGAAVLIAPLIFILLFSLVSGFHESTPGED